MNILLKTFILISLVTISLVNIKDTKAMPNPWTDCNNDFQCAAKVSKTTFPLNVQNPKIRAMEDMIEIDFQLDKSRTVEIRKTVKYISEDISGVYANYQTNKNMKLNNGVIVNIKASNEKIYIMNMSTETGYYSAYCENGMTKDNIEKIYELIRSAEEPKYDIYESCEMGDIVGEDVKRIKYKKFIIDYHTQDFSKKQIKMFVNQCITENAKTQRDMDCCIRFKMYGS